MREKKIIKKSHKDISPKMHFLRVNKKWVTHGKEASMRQRFYRSYFPLKQKKLTEMNKWSP